MTGWTRGGRRALTAPVALGLALAVLPLARPAYADPIDSARDRAAKLRTQVDALQVQTEIASQRFDALQSQLGDAVAQELLAQQQLANAQNNAQATRQVTQARVRAVYMAGGQLATIAEILSGASASDLTDRLHVMQSIVQAGNQLTHQADTVVHESAAIEARLTTLAATKTRLQAEAATTADRVRTLLASTRHALAGADAEVRHLVAAQQAAEQAAAQQSFLAAQAAGGGLAIDPALGGSSTPPTTVAAAAIAAARTRLGDPYVWGATGPSTFDCSGLTQWAYRQAGLQIPRVAADQWNSGPHPSLAALAPGDLLFWATDLRNPASIYHVAMYLGAGQMIAAPHTGDVVKVEPVYGTNLIGATRPTATG